MEQNKSDIIMNFEEFKAIKDGIADIRNEIFLVIQKYIGYPITTPLKHTLYNDLCQVFNKYTELNLQFTVEFDTHGNISITPLNHNTENAFRLLNI